MHHLGPKKPCRISPTRGSECRVQAASADLHKVEERSVRMPVASVVWQMRCRRGRNLTSLSTTCTSTSTDWPAGLVERMEPRFVVIAQRRCSTRSNLLTMPSLARRAVVALLSPGAKNGFCARARSAPATRRPVGFAERSWRAPRCGGPFGHHVGGRPDRASLVFVAVHTVRYDERHPSEINRTITARPRSAHRDARPHRQAAAVAPVRRVSHDEHQ